MKLISSEECSCNQLLVADMVWKQENIKKKAARQVALWCLKDKKIRKAIEYCKVKCKDCTWEGWSKEIIKVVTKMCDVFKGQSMEGKLVVE